MQSDAARFSRDVFLMYFSYIRTNTESNTLRRESFELFKGYSCKLWRSLITVGKEVSNWIVSNLSFSNILERPYNSEKYWWDSAHSFRWLPPTNVRSFHQSIRMENALFFCRSTASRKKMLEASCCASLKQEVYNHTFLLVSWSNQAS